MGLSYYIDGVFDAFGYEGVHFAMLLELFEGQRGKTAQARHSPGKCTCVLPRVMAGNPDGDHVSMSFIERQNLTVRMSNRRFTRLTNAFSKKWRNHEHAIALHYFHYNFCRKHLTLGNTPAIAAGITNRAWTTNDPVVRLEKEEQERVRHARINREDRTDPPK